MSTSTSHEGSPVAAQPLRPPAPTRPFGWSSGAWIVNGVLVLALVALGAYAYTRLTASGSTSAATRTATEATSLRLGDTGFPGGGFRRRAGAQGGNATPPSTTGG